MAEPHGINRIMDKTSRARVDGRFDDERHNLAIDIMKLSPPAPGCRERARRILQNKFSLNELEVLAEALRNGIDSVVKLGAEGDAPLIH
jgi:hypothetical protein